MYVASHPRIPKKKYLYYFASQLILIIFSFFCSYFEDPNTRPVAMVSRRKILSRSRDDLNLEDSNSFRPDRAGAAAEEEDVWYAKEKLYKVSKKIYSISFVHSCLKKLLLR